MAREFEVLERLRPHLSWVPEAIAYSADPELLGAEFFVMKRLEGTILRRDLPPGLTLPPAAARTLSERFISRLAELHRLDPQAVGLDGFGRGDGYVRRQVAGWSDRFRRARTANVPRAERLLAWLDRHAPADSGRAVLHNDFRLDNLVLDPADPTCIVGVLDWEMATVGDPLMDLAGALAYWVEAGDDPLFRALRRQPSHLPGMLTREELVAAYCAAVGIPLVTPEAWRFFEVFGLFRLAAIAQQIYLRYARRESRDPAFRFFWLYVHYLIWRCHRRIRRRP